MTPESEAVDASTPDGEVVADARIEPEPTCDNVTCGANAHCALGDAKGIPECFCDVGYEGDARAGCVDIDECATDNGKCSESAICTNIPGTRGCSCKPGYEGDGVTCMANPCEPRANPCDMTTTTCRADGGQAVCDCVANRDRCDGNPFACKTNLMTDRYNCGACDYACAGSLACNSSECEQPASQLALGTNHSCALKDNGDVWCWGRNDYLQLGSPTSDVGHSTPIKVDIKSVVQLDAGLSRTCAITSDAHLECWGVLYLIQGKSGPDASGFADVGRVPLEATRGMAVGGAAACVLQPDHAFSWGYNTNDALSSSVAANEGRSYASKVDTALSDTKFVDVGARASCVVTGGGHVSCWGGGASPNLRVIEKADGAPLSGVAQVSVSLAEEGTSPVDTACALTTAGNVWCWGGNAQGQLGNPATTATSSLGAVQVTDSMGTPIEHVVEVAVGAYHACARFDDGLVVCWGRTDLIGSGRAGTAIRRSPVEVKGLTDAIELKAGTLHTCARRRTGQVVCWGNNASGQLGVDPATTPTSNVPVNVTNLP